ncbi:GNAT family N-acetyltransferase [Pelagibacterium lentulum]|uniref:BioF2-like acetyltransferase domain-containing protein n=1 Tax=Pelagibacterium lentulum TaxID=2029865 RepID=A0A916VY97_9HYPH|nr:GNAT family N-acetyltransferase [Pelagibacterium lentulum]GGA52956.1 hypothetical protein GCM10011499_23850 [Pelagibacterium lentulum]
MYAVYNRLTASTPAPRTAWVQALENDPEAVAYHLPQWFDSICQSGRFLDCSRLYTAEDGGAFILPMVRPKGVPERLATAASMPSACGQGGIIGTRPFTIEVAEAVWKDLLQLPYLRIQLRPNPRQGPVWAATRPPGVHAIPRRSHILDLSGGFQTVWETRFNGPKRTAVRKAEKLGVEIESDTTGRLVPEFYGLLTESFTRWGSQQNEPLWLTRLRGGMRDPISKFEIAAKKMGGAMRIWLARFEGIPIAAIVVLEAGNANYARGAMDKERVGATRSNELLHRMAIEHAVNAGCRYYHMGESGWSKSLSQFKEGFGAMPYEYEEYFIEKLPITRIDATARGLVKRMIGFKD